MDIASSKGQYYNTSDPTAFSVNGLPYGFQARKLKGYEDGFPVLFETKLNLDRTSKILQYVADGKYIDKKVRGECSARDEW